MSRCQMRSRGLRATARLPEAGCPMGSDRLERGLRRRALRRAPRGALLLVTCLSLLAAAPGGAAVDQLLGRFNGFYDLAVGGGGTDRTNQVVRVDKPTDQSKVVAAFLIAASRAGAVIPDGAISLEGTPIDWDVTVSGTPSSGGGAFENVAAEVTEVVRARLDAAPAGPITLRVREGAITADVEGAVVAVVFARPDLVEPRTVVLMMGYQGDAGDQLSIPVGAPMALAGAGALAELSIGIASSCQSASCPPGDDQRTELSVGGAVLSRSAGGDDDGFPAATPGGLLSVGGFGDLPDNPDPAATPSGDERTDDERYDLLGFVADGDTTVVVDSANPSGDDNFFFLSFVATTQPFVVNDLADDVDANPGDGLCASAAAGTCTIRAAIEEAAASGARTVLVPAGDYFLGGFPLFFGGDVSVVGVLPNPGDAVRIDASADGRLMTIDPDPGPIRVDLQDLVLTNGDGFALAGGILVGNATVTLNRVSVEGNRAEFAGGILNGGRLTLIESTVQGNQSTGNSGSLGDGGGIVNQSGAELTLVDSTISGNVAGGAGGGLFAADGVTVLRSTFDGNVAGESGGGILLTTTTRPTRIEESAFSNNTADALGGGLAALASQLVVVDTTFADNDASFGGGLSLQSDPTLGPSVATVLGSSFLRNRADGVRQNGFGFGGGIFNDAELVVRTSLFDANTTTGTGGGLMNFGTGVVSEIAFSTFQANVGESTVSSGGGITNAGQMAVRETSFVANVSNAGGGGITNLGTLQLDDSLLNANVAVSGGGLFDANTAVLRDVTISGNQAQSAAGVLSNGVTGLFNVTVTANPSSLGAGQGALDATAGNITMANTLVSANAAPGVASLDCVGSGIVSLGFNLDSDGSCPGSGPGDLANTDPLLGPLADNGGSTPTHALLFGSPAVEAGDPSPPGTGITACDDADQRGISRNAPLTGRCDIGAFERQGLEPVFFGRFRTGAWPEAIEVVEDGPDRFAWIAAQDAGLVVFDVTTPDDPINLGTLVPSAALCPDGFNLQELRVEDDTLWIAAGTCGVIRADVSSPGAPVFLDRFDTEAFAVELDLLEGGDELFVADHFGGLRIYDKSDPADVVELGSILTGDFTLTPPFERAALAVSVSERDGRTLAWVATVDGAFVVDASDPLLPEVAGEFLTSGPGCVPAGCLTTFSILDPVGQAQLMYLPHQVHVDGDRALVPAFRGGLIELDVAANPDGSFTLSERQTLPTSQAFYRVESQGDFKFATEGQCGLRVLEDPPGGFDGYEDAQLRASPNPLLPTGAADMLCDPDPFISANPFAWDLVERSGLIWLTTGILPASGPLDGGFEAIDFELGSSASPSCGLLGLEPLAVAFLLARRRRRRGAAPD